MKALDEVFFTDIYKQYAARLLRICMAYCQTEAEAQDLMQETFVKVWQNRHQFRGEAKISTWIYRIAVNTCLGHFRSKKNIAATSLSNNFDLPDDRSSSTAEQHVHQLYQAIHQLAEADRLIISMVLEEIPYPEIAASLSITEGNLRVKIHRIKQELTKIFFRYEQL